MDTNLAPTPDSIHLRLDGFEGLLDLLLDLARRQRVDLARISLTMLVDQYLNAVTSADRTDLIQAAEWLVIAAWLTWLKTRLLVPADPEAAQEAEQAQHVLNRRLMELERVRATADWLNGQPQLGWDMFERGYFEKPDAAVPAATFMMLTEACLGVFRLASAHPAEMYRPRRVLEWTPSQAILRMDAILRWPRNDTRAGGRPTQRRKILRRSADRQHMRQPLRARQAKDVFGSAGLRQALQRRCGILDRVETATGEAATV